MDHDLHQELHNAVKAELAAIADYQKKAAAAEEAFSLRLEASRAMDACGVAVDKAMQAIREAMR